MLWWVLEGVKLQTCRNRNTSQKMVWSGEVNVLNDKVLLPIPVSHENPERMREFFTENERISQMKEDRVVTRWWNLSVKASLENRRAAKVYMVLRARRIWGKLGNLLKTSPVCRSWRNYNMFPTWARRWVKVWRPGPI